MTTGAIIVTYHTSPATLKHCLASLQQTDIAERIVVDNSPTGAVAQVAERLGAAYVPQSGNRGFAAAANSGAQQLSADFLLFINPDAALQMNAHRTASQYLKKNPACGIVGLTLISPQGEPELKSFGNTVTPLSLATRHRGVTTLPKKPLQVGWVSGGAMLIRRRLFAKLGGFDERFFLYWEDVDLCRRANRFGWQTVLLPYAVATHSRGASLSNMRHKTYLYDQSADKYFCKHYPKTICLTLRFLRSLYRLYLPQVE